MKAEHEGNEPQVIIVGAGPAGLALAIELGMRSIRCLLIEKNERGGYAPRAKTTNARTREHLRRWGIADRLAAASPFGIDYPADVHFVTRLASHNIVCFANTLACSPKRDERYAEHSQWIPQYKLESILLEHARSLAGVQIRFSEELIDLEQDSSNVTARLRSTSDGSECRVAGKFLVGADGARSVVRELIGAKLAGTYGLSRNYNTIFRAPGLAQAHRHGPGIMYLQINKDVPSLIGPMDRDDLWYFMPTDVPNGVTYTDHEVAALIQKSTGIDLPYKILSSDVWVASCLLADRYAAGRVFLTGDACHLHPPFGGYGMNMGIADSVDLGWKIAAVLQGWGGRTLLDSYEMERRPAHQFVMDEAESNRASSPNSLVQEGIEDSTPQGEAVRRKVAERIRQNKTAEFYSLGVVLGFCYRDSPVIASKPMASRWQASREYMPCAEPGCRAPHRWLGDGRSLYDHFGSGFTLLILEESACVEVAAARREAESTGTPLKIVDLREESMALLYGAPLVLVRPDQHIAWSGHAWPPSGILSLASGRLGTAA